MFGSIGFMEIVLIAGVALMVLGPERFPEFAKIAMRTVRDVRKYVAEAQQEITKELDPVKNELGSISRVDAESYLNRLIEDDEDDKKPMNPEPEFSDADLAAGEQEAWKSAAQDSDIDSAMEHDPKADSGANTESGANAETGAHAETVDDNRREEAVEYNLYGVETEGADPYGVNPAEEGDFDLTGGFGSKPADAEEAEAEESERLDG